MQVKKRDLPLVIGFCAVLIGLQAAFWFLPKQEFSVNEKRVLQEFPEMALVKLMERQMVSIDR